MLAIYFAHIKMSAIMKRIRPAHRKTFVFIDASNIRYACRNSSGFEIDFSKYIAYLKRKYKNLVEVRYYEGISNNDAKKKKYFEWLKNEGYIICSLERKAYVGKAKFKIYSCCNCETKNSVQILSDNVKLKSNVDVYLASNMIKCAIKNSGSIHIVLVSCDGDYAEAIKDIIEINPESFVTIVATPRCRKNNCLSSRLRVLRCEFSDNVMLMNIEKIKDIISSDKK